MAIKTFTTGEVLTAADTNTYLANAGLVYVTSLTVTGQTAGAINSCFTSTYDNYRVIFTTTAMSYSSLIVWTLRAGGTDDYSNYYWSTWATTAGGATGANSANPGTTAGLAYTNTALPYGTQIVELTGPKLAAPTPFFTEDTRHDTGSYVVRLGGGVHNVSTAFDGIRFGTGGATMNATITVYGYRKA